MSSALLAKISRYLLLCGIGRFLSGRSRQHKVERLLRLIGNNPRVRVLDVGAGGEWQGAESTLEACYCYPQQLVAVSPEAENVQQLKEKYPAVRWVLADGLQLCFSDGAFDVAHANAVIEHIHGEQSRRQFISEMLRVSRVCFVTTPNAFFPVEVHTRLPFIHWLPDRWHNSIVEALGMGSLSKGPQGYYEPISPRKLRSYFPSHLRVRVDVGWLGMTAIAVCEQGERALNNLASEAGEGK